MRFVVRCQFFAVAVLCVFVEFVQAQTVLSCGKSGEIRFEADSSMLVAFADASTWKADAVPGFMLRAGDRDIPSISFKPTAKDRCEVGFDDGSVAVFQTSLGDGFVLFRLERIDAKSEIDEIEMGRFAIHDGAKIDSTLGRVRFSEKFVAASTASINVRPLSSQAGCYQANRDGCTHDFQPCEGKEKGLRAAKYTASCNEKGGGWSVRGIRFPTPLDLTGLKAIRATVHGDAQGESLKIQPTDSAGNCRDTYIPINFTGWKEITVSESPHDKITKPAAIAGVNIYYNGIPANKTVECLIDKIEAICELDGKEVVVLLEDFESLRSVWWAQRTNTMKAVAGKKHGIDGAAFGILFGTESDFSRIMPEFEIAAGLPSPRFDGIWNKISPDVKRSYFFLTNFKEQEFDDALAIAKRGGFDRILILQHSWTKAPGHYEVNTNSFPDGLPGLVRTVKRFKDAGFKTGFHFLAASIDPPDSYLTTIPENRLVYGAKTELSSDIPVDAKFVPTSTAPTDFPVEDGGYNGKGRVLRIGDELIVYGKIKTEAPFGFEDCKRGHLGTKIAAHSKGTPIRHLVREYGYHMIDLDTDLLPEVAANFAKVADACNIDMMYFDGSERLQGDHWYYNPKLQKAFYDAVKNKNMLMQGSSFTPYSWHQLARGASADGHGDLKGYLDQRSPYFTYIENSVFPLDIGWYYAYDVNSTIDMYEYILLATIAYDSSMSLQVSVSAAHKHPFTGDLLDKIKRFETLRLSGRITPEIREKLKIDPKLGGKKPEEIAESFSQLRKEYRLLGEIGKEYFQRVVYTPWKTVSADADPTWEVEIPANLGTVRVGFNVYLPPEAKEKTLTDPSIEIDGKRITLKTTLVAGQYAFYWPDESVRINGLPLKETNILPPADTACRQLEPGKHAVKFIAAETPYKVRLTYQSAERIEIP